jgi:hypothetical protein
MGRGLDVCRGCHRSIHRLIPDQKQLGRHFNTRKKLLGHAKLGRYVRWKQRRARREDA